MVGKISIKSKIIAAFMVVLCCTIGLGLFALQRLDAVNLASAQVRDKALPSTRALARITYTTMRMRTLDATQLLAHDPAEKAEEKATFDTIATAANDAFAAYDPLVGSESERHLYDQMKSTWASYLRLHDRFAVLAQQPDPTAAFAFFRGDMRTLSRQLQDELQMDVTLNVREGNRLVDEGAALSASAHRWILLVLAAMVLLCTAVGYVLVRCLSAPIAAMTRAIAQTNGFYQKAKT